MCRVSEDETYRGNTQFQLRQGCTHYQCNCHCNGSWECPGDTARDVCIGEVRVCWWIYAGVCTGQVGVYWRGTFVLGRYVCVCLAGVYWRGTCAFVEYVLVKYVCIWVVARYVCIGEVRVYWIRVCIGQLRVDWRSSRVFPK